MGQTTVSDAAVVETTKLHLQLSFTDVATRANRLQEWMELESYLVSLRYSFEQFNNEVKLITGNPDETTTKRLKELWRRCNVAEFPDLRAFLTGVQFINKSLSSNDNEDSNSIITTWINNLLNLNIEIQKNLNETNLGALKNNSDKFQEILDGYIADRRMIVSREVKVLCKLTDLLKIKLEL